MDTEIIKDKVLTEGASLSAGVSAPMMAVAVAGQPGVSAVGLSTGLAALGFGSMWLGVGVAALIGIGAYNVVKAMMEDEGEN